MRKFALTRLAAGAVAAAAIAFSPFSFSAAITGSRENFSQNIIYAAGKKKEKNESMTRLSQENARLDTLAESPYQWTGIAVTPGARIFVSFPRWGAAPPDYSLAEVKDGSILPLAVDIEFGSLRRLAYDPTGKIWGLDEGSPEPNAPEQLKAPRLLSINIDDGKLADTYVIPAEVLAAGSRLSDFRLDFVNKKAYISDMGEGAILVLDLTTKEVYRALFDIPEVKQNITMIYFPNTGIYNKLGHVTALELPKDAKELYFCAMGGDIIYRVPTSVLLNRTLSVADRRKKITAATLHGTPTSGMVLRDTTLFMGDLPDDGIWEFDFLDDVNKGGLFDVNIDIRWADSFAIDGEKNLYFTVTQNNYAIADRGPYKLYRIYWDRRRAMSQMLGDN